MKILMLSPYDAASHRYWREGLVARFAAHDFTVVTLPPRHFSWRFRGNSLSLAHDQRVKGEFDLIVATSMTDLSALKGMATNLAQVPAILYFHENQFVYPASAPAPHLLERQITSIYSAIAARTLVFNSYYNRDTFLDGVGRVLRSMPDHVPDRLCESLAHKSRVIPVALDDECFRQHEPVDVFSIVWNHRWEYDKGPRELLDIVRCLLLRNMDFRLHLIGQRFRKVDKAFSEAIDLLDAAGKLGESGFVESRRDYLDLLARSHCVLSTAIHDFQGLSVQEGMAAGCTPVVPDRLAYREYVPDSWRYRDAEQAADLVCKAATDTTPVPAPLPRWREVQPAWEAIFSPVS